MESNQTENMKLFQLNLQTKPGVLSNSDLLTLRYTAKHNIEHNIAIKKKKKCFWLRELGRTNNYWLEGLGLGLARTWYYINPTEGVYVINEFEQPNRLSEYNSKQKNLEYKNL